MSTNVFANKREIACKASSGKSVAQFPDVCFSPPTAPPTPPGTPVPYPSTAKASDCKKGSKEVKIGGKPVMLRDKSFIGRTLGDEAGSAPKKNILTSTNKGKAYFASWSMDVKVEGQNVPRHLDRMSHNHASQPGDGTVWVYMSVQAAPTGTPSRARCTLVAYRDGCDGMGKKKMTPHHCVPDHCFKEAGKAGTYYPGAIKHADGLCICVEGSGKYTSKKTSDTIKEQDYSTWRQHYHALAEHGRIHAKFDETEAMLGLRGKPPQSASLGQLETAAAKVIAEVTGCDEASLKKQLRAYHHQNGLPANTKLRADPKSSYPDPPRRVMGRKRQKRARLPRGL